MEQDLSDIDGDAGKNSGKTVMMGEVMTEVRVFLRLIG